jgi:hypothetical protein
MAFHLYFISKKCAKNINTFSGKIESLNVKASVHVIRNVRMDWKSKGSNLCLLGTAVPISLKSLPAISLDKTTPALPSSEQHKACRHRSWRTLNEGRRHCVKQESSLCVLPLATSAAKGLHVSNGRGVSFHSRTPVPHYNRQRRSL